MATFYNKATLFYNNTSTDSNTVTGELVEVLSAYKSALNESYGVGDTVTYLVTLNNTGTAAVENLTLSDDLGTYSQGSLSLNPLTYVENSVRYYQNGVQQTAPTVVAGPPFTVTGITVPAGGSALLVYAAKITEFAPLGTGAAITNTATVSGASLANNITATQILDNSNAAALSISKSICPDTVSVNGEISYTFVVQNTGAAATVAENVSITDTFTPLLNNITVTLNGTALVENTDYTYNVTSGQFQTVAGRITVPAATYAQNATTGVWSVTPGVSVLKVTGTV